MMNQKLFHDLIGEKITNIYRVRVSDTGENGEDTELSDILVFSAESGLLLEFIVGQASSETLLLTHKNEIRVDFELDEDEVCQLYESDREKDSCELPFVVWGITEVWAGADRDRFLTGVIFWNETRKPLLSLYTEGDDMDILSFGEMERCVTRINGDYSSVKEFCYGIYERIIFPPESDQTDSSNPVQTEHEAVIQRPLIRRKQNSCSCLALALASCSCS